MLALNNSFAESKHYYINKINTLTGSIPMTKNAWQIVPLSIEKLQPELTFQINDFAVIFHHKKVIFSFISLQVCLCCQNVARANSRSLIFNRKLTVRTRERTENRGMRYIRPTKIGHKRIKKTFRKVIYLRQERIARSIWMRHTNPKRFSFQIT